MLALTSIVIPGAFAMPEVGQQVSQKESSAPQPANIKPANQHLAGATMTTTIKAPLHFIWATLTNFDQYPNIFNRLRSLSVTKRDVNFVYIESHLKPGVFIKSEVQHTVNDLGGGPNALRWQTLDGNFKHVEGDWHLKAVSPTRTEVTYHLAVDAGPVIPSALVSFVIHFLQQEIVTSFAQYTEKSFLQQEKAQAGLDQPTGAR